MIAAGTPPPVEPGVASFLQALTQMNASDWLTHLVKLHEHAELLARLAVHSL